MRALLTVVLAISVAGCKCGPEVAKVNPSIGVSPAGLDFGQVKLGQSKQLTVKVDAQTRTALALSSVKVEGGGAAAYRLGTVPTEVASLESATFTVTFTPPAVAAFAASVVIASNDPDRPSVKVALVGEGAEPKLEVTPDCQAAQGCTAAVTVQPPAIDFGQEPRARPVPIEVTKLPTVVVVNAGAVPLEVSSVRFGGADPAAFSIAGNNAFPDGGVTLGAAEGFNLPIRFVPTSAQQTSYAGTLLISSDDPAAPEVSVALTGTLKPNEPPSVCANVIRVVPQVVTEPTRDYGSAAEWATLLVPPATGYDFVGRRDVRPNDLVVLSALSDATDQTKCTTDPEDGRNGLSFRWVLTSTPRGAESLTISSPTSPQAQFRPLVTGTYEVSLMVTDSQAASVTTTLRLAVAVKQDLVAQLQWPGSAGVDLDLHLVRPSAVTGSDPWTGAFAFFEAGPANRTSGDLNGYARRLAEANPGAGYDFDWGQPGSADDPVLNVDDVGDGQLLENVSMNYPEHDARCATTSCTYRVMVHAFDDRRVAVPPACVVDGGVGCLDGEACSCATGYRCVAATAPVGSAPTGAGKCYLAPKPVVRLFFRGSPTPASVIPLEGLMPADEVLLGAPCKLWHVADVEWPALTAIGSLPDGGTPPPVVTVVGADGQGRVTTPSMVRFGARAAGSLKCEPDSTRGSNLGWYSRQP